MKSITLPPMTIQVKRSMGSTRNQLMDLIAIWRESTAKIKNSDGEPMIPLGLQISDERVNALFMASPHNPFRTVTYTLQAGEIITFKDRQDALWQEHQRFLSRLIGNAIHLLGAEEQLERKAVMAFEHTTITSRFLFIPMGLRRLMAYALSHETHNLDQLSVIDALEHFCQCIIQRQILEMTLITNVANGRSAGGIEALIQSLIGHGPDTYPDLLTRARGDILIRKVMRAPEQVFEDDLAILRKCRWILQSHLLVYIRYQLAQLRWRATRTLSQDTLTAGEVSEAFCQATLAAAECALTGLSEDRVDRNNVADMIFEEIAALPHTRSVISRDSTVRITDRIPEFELRKRVIAHIQEAQLKQKVQDLYHALAHVEDLIANVRLAMPGTEACMWLLHLSGHLAMNDYEQEINGLWRKLTPLLMPPSHDVLLQQPYRSALSAQQLLCVVNQPTQHGARLNEHALLMDPRIQDLVRNYVGRSLDVAIRYQQSGRLRFQLLKPECVALLQGVVHHEPRLERPRRLLLSETERHATLRHLRRSPIAIETPEAPRDPGRAYIPEPAEETARYERIAASFQLALNCLQNPQWLPLFLPILCYADGPTEWSQSFLLQEQFKLALLSYYATCLHQQTLQRFFTKEVLKITHVVNLQTEMHRFIQRISPQETQWEFPARERDLLYKKLHAVWVSCFNIIRLELETELMATNAMVRPELMADSARPFSMNESDYTAFFTRDWLHHLKGYKKLLKRQTSLGACIQLLYTQVYAVFGMVPKKPRIMDILPILSRETLREELEAVQIATVPEPRLAQLMDQQGNTLLHKAMSLYPTLSPVARQQVHVLCLLSDTQANNAVDQTPEACLRAALSEYSVVIRDQHLDIVTQYLVRSREQMSHANPAWALVISSAETANARALQAETEKAQLQAKNADLEIKNSDLEIKNSDLESKKADLESKKADLESKNADLEAKNQVLEETLHQLMAERVQPSEPAGTDAAENTYHRFAFR